METPTTADIGMRLVVPVPDYETAGRLMDAVQAAVGVALGHHELTGRFEFVHFNLPIPDGKPFSEEPPVRGDDTSRRRTPE
jgi:hypothetical protein